MSSYFEWKTVTIGLTVNINKIEIVKKRIDGETKRELFVIPDDFNIVYSDALIILRVEKI